ncbi:MAG: hypothetical protein L6367_16385 [Cellulomonas sp.]|nr:hypothetical protein [Cellulomonas sp.]
MNRLRVWQDDDGTSLVEMLVAMALFLVVLVTVTSLTINFTKANAANISRQDQIDSARTAIEAMSKTLRTSVKPSQLASGCGTACSVDAFLVGQDDRVQFYANLDNAGNAIGPSRVTYWVDSAVLKERIQVPLSYSETAGYTYCDASAVGASAACLATVSDRDLAAGVVTTDAPIFQYYKLGSDTVLDPDAAGGSLSSDDLGNLVAVELTVTVRAPNATTVDPSTYIQRVYLPNAQAAINTEATATP